MRNASIHVVLFLCVISLVLSACGGQSNNSSLNGGATVETSKTSSVTPIKPGIAWPMAGNTITNSSFQPLDTNNGPTILEQTGISPSPENISQVVIGTDYHSYMADNCGQLYSYDCYGNDMPWVYTPPNTTTCFLEVTPAWYDPDRDFNTNNERIYHVYQDDTGSIYMVSVLPSGTSEWTCSVPLGNYLMRCAPTVTDEFIYIAEGQTTPMGNRFVQISAIERLTGTVIATSNVALYYDTVTTLAIGNNGYIYMLVANTTTCESALFQIEFTGTQFLNLANTPLLTGSLELASFTGYDSQHGPVVYNCGKSEYVAFSLTDTTAGNSGGVYAFSTSNLLTPAWTYLTGLPYPVYCSGLSEVDGTVVFSHQVSSYTPVPATDTYQSRAVQLTGDTGSMIWLTQVFNGRIGSALSISEERQVYGQARYQFASTLYAFSMAAAPAPAIPLAGPGIAGEGPVSIANFREDDPGLFFIESLYGEQNILHLYEIEVEAGTPWPQAGNTVDKSSYQDLQISPISTRTVTMATGTDNLSQPVVSNDFHTYLSCTDGTILGYDCTSGMMSLTYAPPSVSTNYIAVTPAWYDPDDDPSTNNDRIYHVYQDSSEDVYVVSLYPNGMLDWQCSASLGNSMLRSSPTVYGDYIFIMEGYDTGLGYQVIQISAIDRVTGTVIATDNITLIYDISTNVAVDSSGNLYFIAASSSASLSSLFKVSFSGTTFSLISLTPQLTGTLLLRDPYGYDSQHGPVIYESDSTEYVAFSLADTAAGASGGVYAFATASLTTPVWTAHTGQLTPAYCSGVSAGGGCVFYSYQDPMNLPNPLTDVYQSRAIMRVGSTGATIWTSEVFDGRVGSAFTVSGNLNIFGQARYQTDCSFWMFTPPNSPDYGTVLAYGGVAGNGPVALADYQPNTPAFFFYDALGGLLQIQY